ncbi:hypothetical protein B0T26DRAFT_679725 [Lasiosphaeria miniovina]|uniref:glutathione transferase n=1 Tax=Lasiosphaeria miniovina TaxID=1954250 RepID=A0AA40DLT2_9PEZI|nr:uncharacterized protein B0T26DRAFT_679725 [Lasiosphaeria miniovina]KAK0705966.1 hypothetical protein B0T26DRAFT_679725 [Lasiosphaeria miniovina]
MVLKIYGTKTSTCTKRVLAVLYEKKAGLLHPFGKVPVLEDDGFVLFESRAIANYIARKFAGQGTPLLPADDDVKARALFDRLQAASLEAFYYDPAVSTLVTEKVFKKGYLETFEKYPHVEKWFAGLLALKSW